MSSGNDLGKIIRQRRLTIPLTLLELSSKSGVSASHIVRIENGYRFPSTSILRKIAEPLGFDEDLITMIEDLIDRARQKKTGG